MQFDAAAICAQFNERLRSRGYTGLSTPLAEQTQSGASFTDALSEAGQEFFSHPRIGSTDDDGMPVVGQDAEECLTMVEELAEQSLDRGQDPDNLNFVLGKIPVFDGPGGKLLGYEMRPAVELPRPALIASDGE